MPDTNQLPPSEREAFEAFAQNCPMGKYSIARRGDGYDSSHMQLMWDAWQARTQVQGEPVYWEWRHLGNNQFAADFGQWSEWKRVEARSPIFTAEDEIRTLRRYIADGYKYELRALYDHPAPSVPADAVLDCYDAGLLNDFGGGNVEWWQDYIRAELGRAHDFYQSQIATQQPAQATQAEVTDAQIKMLIPCGDAWKYEVGFPEAIQFARAILALRTERVPMTCHCHTCRPITMGDMRMVLCPKCGNKRCPHANDHRNDCTGSNEPGQPGSAYPAHHGITAQSKKETP